MAQQVPLAEAYIRGYFNRFGTSPADMMKYNDKAASTYDNDLTSMLYSAPHVAAEKAKSLVTDKQRENFKLLDLGAGTGVSGAALRSAGFLGNISALDGSEGMLKIAMEKGVYSDIAEHFLTSSNPLPYPDQSFDMVVSVGTFFKNLVEPDCLEDALRVLKPLSYMVVTIRMYKKGQDYRVRFFDEIARLEAAGLMKVCSRDQFLYLILNEILDELYVDFDDLDGEVMVLQKPAIN
ncbi:methyltransferase-like protein 27 [Ciona intestinalis]